MWFGLVEAYVMLHFEDGDIGGSGEVDGPGRSRREKTEVVAVVRFLGGLRTHVCRLRGALQRDAGGLVSTTL